MGLLDILHGMQNGPRGEREPGTTSGMSKMAMALIALLGYKTLKTGTQPTSRPPDLIDFSMTPNRRLTAVRCQETEFRWC